MPDYTRVPNVTDPAGPKRALAPQSAAGDPVHDYVVRCATPTRTDKAQSATSISLVSTNVYRRGLTIRNTSGAYLYLNFGATAVITDAPFVVEPGETWILPSLPGLYTGEVSGIWDAAGSDKAIVLELTA